MTLERGALALSCICHEVWDSTFPRDARAVADRLLVAGAHDRTAGNVERGREGYRRRVAASKRGDAIRAALLALVIAALSVLPPPDATHAAAPAGLVAATSAGTSATGHRLELHLQERSAPVWPGSQSSHWAVTGPDALTAPPELVGPATVAAPVQATTVHLLANRGRAPPRSLAPAES